MFAFHNDPSVEKYPDDCTVDKFVVNLINRGIISVIPEIGVVKSNRWPRPLGSLNTMGYLVCTLHDDNMRKQIKIHRIVWIYVNGIMEQGLVIDHINRIKSDNRISNLRAVSSAENALNRRSYNGVDSPSARIDQGIADRIRHMHPELSYDALASEFDISKSLVAKIIRKELWA